MMDHQQKAAAFLHSFKNRMGVTISTTQPPNLDVLLPVVEDLEVLVAPFTTEEIDDVVKNMKVDKAPGPDGFNGQFLKKCWHIVKKDYTKLCTNFFDAIVNLESINGSFITLVLKVQSPETVSDF